MEQIEQPPQTDQVLMTVAECAQQARVSKMTIYLLIHSGEIDTVLVGKKSFRIPTSAWADYLKRDRPHAPAQP